jgi:hypothetical protein
MLLYNIVLLIKGTNIDKLGNYIMNKLEFLGRRSSYNVIEGNTCAFIKYEYRKQVYCIHIDGENFIEKATDEGFFVVDIG